VRHKPPSVIAASVVDWVVVVCASRTRDVVPAVKSATHCYGGRSDMNSEGYCGKSKQPERKRLRVAGYAYLWKRGREPPNASWDEIHETREARCAIEWVRLNVLKGVQVARCS